MMCAEFHREACLGIPRFVVLMLKAQSIEIEWSWKKINVML